jgi:hypothetical protein
MALNRSKSWGMNSVQQIDLRHENHCSRSERRLSAIKFVHLTLTLSSDFSGYMSVNSVNPVNKGDNFLKIVLYF